MKLIRCPGCNGTGTVPMTVHGIKFEGRHFMCDGTGWMDRKYAEVPITIMHTPQCDCLNCGKRLDAATGLSVAPSPGDLSVCLRCGAVAIFDEGMTVRGMTEDEMDKLCADAEMMNYLAVVHVVRMGR